MRTITQRRSAAAVVLVLTVVLTVVLTACGVTGDESGPRKPTPPEGTGGPSTVGTPTPTEEPADVRLFPGGRSLVSYEGDPSYPWRVAVVDNRSTIDRALEVVGFDDTMDVLDVGIYDDVIATCDDLDQGADVLAGARRHWARDPASPIDAARARQLVEVSTQYACPDLAR
ncbi:hypothetical protein [Nocardioides sp.]|uniref:hypothetical protein n=1 Tax=Nocardioides sp. TaxID=35761 RepID=UPI002721008A|nr:hypothetical protein [Nocardioides sp.]MDO9456474.1 hypothetical protein [Nocardioides sp.]